MLFGPKLARSNAIGEQSTAVTSNRRLAKQMASEPVPQPISNTVPPLGNEYSFNTRSNSACATPASQGGVPWRYIVSQSVMIDGFATVNCLISFSKN